jgi:glycerophosphoryl diester phosphodiesterase
MADANSLGIRVIPWVINEPDRMGRLLGMGVADIITDHPNRLRKVLADNHLPLPPAVSIP